MKKKTGVNVFNSAVYRISYVFDFFGKIYLSFSGGKDSSVMLHLVAAEARRRGRKFGVLIVDLEAQYKHTINHINEIVNEYDDVIELYWVALPISLRNAVSVYEPKRQCWEPGIENVWVRNPDSKSITDEKFFPFFKRGMEFEEFVPKFGEWYSNGDPTACFVGIRSDESLNRYRAIANNKKETFGGKCYTTKIYKTNVYNVYPIYDWQTRDIWIYNGKFNKSYNKLYDLMNQAGLSIHQQRICQPYGDGQRKGLYLYHVIEPETWAKVVARVSGANSGSEFVTFNGNASGQIRVTKPDDHTWESYCNVLLNSMPSAMKDHYANKIHVFLKWYGRKGVVTIPDFADAKLESAKKVPSWRRIAKMLLRNDYWAKGLSFTMTKHGYHYEQYMKRITAERKEREQENRKFTSRLGY